MGRPNHAEYGGIMKLFDLNGRVAVVTGGNRGIGRAMAVGLAEAGAAVLVAGRDAEKCAGAVAELEALGARAAPFIGDVTDADVLSDLAEAAGVDRADFLEFFPTRKMIYLTASDFFRSQSMGVSGFPTVILRTDKKLSLLSTGFRPFEDIKPHLDQWLESDPKDAAGAETAPQ